MHGGWDRAIKADAAECGKAGTSPKFYTGINKLHHIDHTYAFIRNVAIIGKFTLCMYKSTFVMVALAVVSPEPMDLSVIKTKTSLSSGKLLINSSCVSVNTI